jgi:hypothetical protein
MSYITNEQAAALATRYTLPQGLGKPHWPLIFNEVIRHYLDGAAKPVEVCWNLKYKDSTPTLNVGHSAFEDWFQQQPFATQVGVKQLCRDSYAAGMGDPLVTYAQPAKPVELSDDEITVIGNNYSDTDAAMTWDVWPVFARAILTAAAAKERT